MNVKLLGSLALSALIFSACSVKTVPYHSDVSITADKKIEFRSINTVTDFSVVEGLNSDLKYPDFGVISALDNGTEHYSLIVPTFDEASAKGSPKLSLYNLDHAIVLTDAHVVELMRVIDLAVADWNVEYPTNKGKNLAYTVITDEPTFDFHYQNSENGSIASVIVATGKDIQVEADGGITYPKPIAYTFELTSAQELEGFKDLLNHSLNPVQESAPEEEVLEPAHSEAMSDSPQDDVNTAAETPAEEVTQKTIEATPEAETTTTEETPIVETATPNEEPSAPAEAEPTPEETK